MPSAILTPAQWAALPEEIQVRIVRFTAACRGFRTHRITLVTTLLDVELYRVAELVALYLRRWRIELCLRDVKTTLGLEPLRCQSPAMVRKELLAGWIAHNLIRCLMAEAAQVHEADLERFSFNPDISHSVASEAVANRRSAGFQPAVSPTSSRQTVRIRPDVAEGQHVAQARGHNALARRVQTQRHHGPVPLQRQRMKSACSSRNHIQCFLLHRNRAPRSKAPRVNNTTLPGSGIGSAENWMLSRNPSPRNRNSPVWPANAETSPP